MGVNVSICSTDLSDKSSLEQALAQIHPPVKGVIQCAMVLRDILFEKMTAKQWRESLAPKVHGTRHLDELVGDVDFFIMLSSFAGIFGNLTQSNYAAACAFQDALAHERRARGQTASTAIDLGIIREVGYLAENGSSGYLQQWEQEFGLDETMLHSLLLMGIGNDLPAQVITGLPTEKTAKVANIPRPFYLDDLKFSKLLEGHSSNRNDNADTSGAPSSGAGSDLSNASSKEEAREIVRKAMLGKIAACLQIDETTIDITRPLHSYGVDSLVAVEIRTWIFRQLKVNLSVFDLTAGAPIRNLIDRIMTQSEALPLELRS